MEKLTVVKIGGKVIDNEKNLGEFLDQFSKIEGPKILVHGGGKLATKFSQRLGLEPKMIEGRRVTDAEALEVVTMIYGGLVNKNIVAGLQARGTNAIGLCGADANLIKAHKRPLKNGIDYGFVGDVDRVNDQVLLGLVNLGLVPIVAPLTHDSNSQLLNTNADTMAAETAIAMSKHYETSLFYTFELEGVMKDINDPNSLINQMGSVYYKELKQEGVVHSGMIPKLDNAFDSLRRGINNLFICHYSRVLDICNSKSDIGTRLYLDENVSNSNYDE